MLCKDWHAAENIFAFVQAHGILLLYKYVSTRYLRARLDDKKIFPRYVTLKTCIFNAEKNADSTMFSFLLHVTTIHIHIDFTILILIIILIALLPENTNKRFAYIIKLLGLT